VRYNFIDCYLGVTLWVGLSALHGSLLLSLTRSTLEVPTLYTAPICHFPTRIATSLCAAW